MPVTNDAVALKPALERRLPVAHAYPQTAQVEHAQSIHQGPPSVDLLGQSAALRRLGLAAWGDYDRAAVYESLVKHAARVAVPATHDVLGVSIECDPHLYHPDANSSSVFLLRHLLDELSAESRPLQVLEVGSGTGAVSLALAHRLPSAQVMGADIDPRAVACARGNAQRNRLEVVFEPSDLFSAFAPTPRFDVIVFGIPFFADPAPQGLHPSTRRALCDPEGRLLSRFLHQASAFLKPGGCIYLLLSNIGNLDPLNYFPYRQRLVGAERFSTGFFRALVQLVPL